MLRPEDCFDHGTAPVDSLDQQRENLRAGIVDDICAQSRDAGPTFPVYVVMRNEPSISTMTDRSRRLSCSVETCDRRRTAMPSWWVPRGARPVTNTPKWTPKSAI